MQLLRLLSSQPLCDLYMRMGHRVSACARGMCDLFEEPAHSVNRFKHLHERATARAASRAPTLEQLDAMMCGAAASSTRSRFSAGDVSTTRPSFRPP